ncbi:MAG: hypothetical protein M3Y85_06320 [Bacteroidota bacterium]|nr:hypothetical protein [Bacteroidota bacterium]
MSAPLAKTDEGAGDGSGVEGGDDSFLQKTSIEAIADKVSIFFMYVTTNPFTSYKIDDSKQMGPIMIN